MEIATDRLTLRQISQEDWPLFLRLHTDPGVVALCFDIPNLQSVQEKFQERLLAWTADSGAWLCLVLVEHNTDEMIGVTGFSLKDGIAEVGYLLLPEYHGQKYATESLDALIEWAVSQLNIRDFKAIVTEGNIASERVLVKCGFKLTSITPNAYEIAGDLYSDLIFTMSVTS
ncbi:GNAT family N-acetyltransferase [Vibrio kasasachensis]|uniref:GNAT family N-acetyltransferase n=1 Tax=Vibrio kasasachensis TaxID=2910248 RepID=UPI003D11A380